MSHTITCKLTPQSLRPNNSGAGTQELQMDALHHPTWGLYNKCLFLLIHWDSNERLVNWLPGMQKPKWTTQLDLARMGSCRSSSYKTHLPSMVVSRSKNKAGLQQLLLKQHILSAGEWRCKVWIQHLQPNFILKPAELITPYWSIAFCIFQCKFKIKNRGEEVRFLLPLILLI